MTDWRDDAACRNYPPEAFVFPEKDNRRTHIAWCKAICAGCEVRQPCLDAELEWMRDGTTSVGIFGGTTPSERRRILNRPDRTGIRNVWAPIPHGTQRGRSAHQRRNEDPCPACRIAHNDDMRTRRLIARPPNTWRTT